MKKLMLSLLICLCFQCVVKAQSSKSEEQLRQEILLQAKKTQEYKDVYLQIRTLENNINLAKKGTINKTQLLNHYNNNLGRSMGRAKDFNRLSKLVTNKSKSFLQMRLYQIAAKIALEEAAEKDNSINR
ncbi:hypothetical protein ACS5PU_19675 [Pedobacter sp. GSP4]|uniref:hypothetical protein n=1 Tax=Pedobacter sp. GSP4 TaxID=3453716 RepID=UPI003EEFA1D5